MISPNENAGDGRRVVDLTNSLATAAKATLASFASVTSMIAAVGDIAVSYGVGMPLAAFQTLLKTYQTLLRAEDVLTKTANQILHTAREHAGGSIDP